MGAGLLAVVSCGPAAPEWASGTTTLRETGQLRDPRLRESSAVVRGPRNPAVAWTLGDSGNEPRLFAVDTTGRVVQAVTIEGARNSDWEALAAGPCGRGTCLFIGDVGDNLGRRRSLTLYRVEEPDLAQAPTRVELNGSLEVRLEDGPHDIEALVVTPDGDVAMISKGWWGSPRVYWIPSAAWSSPTATARLVDTLPLPTRVLGRQLVTDAALAPDGQRLAVRTYREVFLFTRQVNSRWLPDRPEWSCPLGNGEPQGEGIGWWDDTTLVLTSERARGRSGTVMFLRCDPQ